MIIGSMTRRDELHVDISMWERVKKRSDLLFLRITRHSDFTRNQIEAKIKNKSELFRKLQ
jgi:hypothetical protein